MNWKRTIWVLLVALVLVISLWGWTRVTSQDKDLRMSGDGAGGVELPAVLQGRLLVFTTNANVPLRIVSGGSGYEILELLGVPKSIRPFEINVGREPVREEWNVGVLMLGMSGDLNEVRYLTENNGSYTHARLSSDGGYVIATRHDPEGGRDNVLISVDDIFSEPVSFSHSIDQWPSIGRDGRSILFQSFRDGNPGGDLYLAVIDDESEGERVTYRLTENPEVEYVWPMMDAESTYCVAVEREFGEEAGRLILWEIEEYELSNPVYLNEIPEIVKHPSLSRNGEVCCWEDRTGGKRSVVVWWGESEGQIVIGPPSNPSNPSYPGYGWFQPSISPDGRFVSFLEDIDDAGSVRIGIYDLETGSVFYLTGCGGNVMFPNLSDRMETE